MLTLLLATMSAFAQDPVEGGDMPQINAQLFRPSVDARSVLWADESEIREDNPLVIRSLVQWVNGPLVYRDADGEVTPLVGNLFELDLTGAYSKGPVRIGVHLPVYLRSLGSAGGQTGLGDIGLDGKVRLINREDGPVGLALSARAGLPTNTTSAALGAGGFTYELAAIVDKQAGPVTVTANIGTRGQPEVDLENFTWGDQLFARLGAGYNMNETTGISLDLAGQGNYASLGKPNSSPVEALLGGWARPNDGSLVIRGGVGAGLTAAVGAPALRVLLGVEFSPNNKPKIPPIIDTDGDGFFDDVDACITDPETVNAYKDDDGCPDNLGDITIRVVDPKGNPITNATIIFNDEALPVGADGSLMWSDLMPGTTVNANAAADKRQMLPAQSLEIAEGSNEIKITLDWLPARVAVSVVEMKGKKKVPVPAELNFFALEGKQKTTGKTGEDGQAKVEVPPGEWRMSVIAEGYRVENRTMTLDPDSDKVIEEIIVKPAKVKVTKEAIVILDKVFFDSGKATVKAESMPLLIEIAETIVANPQIKLVEVQGHTDDQGNDAYNLDLSQRRVDEVRRHLLEKGVQPERLVAKGYGETQPIADNKSATGRAENRRVNFAILEQEAIVIEVELEEGKGVTAPPAPGTPAPAPAAPANP